MKENKERSLRETTVLYKTGWKDHMRTRDNHYAKTDWFCKPTGCQVAGKPRKIRPVLIWSRNFPKLGLVLFVDVESNFDFQSI
jgi:hypothetical protein